MQSLISKLNNHEASIAVIGLGYVGLPLACSLTEAGFLVTGIDLDKAKIKTLNNYKILRYILNNLNQETLTEYSAE